MNSDKVVCMMSTLKGFITERRKELGMNQTELANRSGVPRTTVNRIETGTTKLPEADVRRKLAKALGVRHVDLLIAAGELAANEVEPADDSCSEAVRRLQPRIDRVSWDSNLKWAIAESILDNLADPSTEP
jgi:transcriptional regulator with XRE-family HTH domain